MGNFQKVCCAQKVPGSGQPEEEIVAVVLDGNAVSILDLIQDEQFWKGARAAVVADSFLRSLTASGVILKHCAKSGAIYYYQGDFKDGINGNGCMLSQKGLLFGCFERGRPTQLTQVIFKNMATMQAYFKNGQPVCGVYREGEYWYKGSLVDWKKHGKGEQGDGTYRFKGSFFQGQRDKGIYFFDSNNKEQYFEGQFDRQGQFQAGVLVKRDMKITNFKLGEDGQLVFGEVEYGNQDQYKGQFKGCQRHGRGKYLSKSRKTIFQGEFRENRREGRGVLQLAEGIRFQLEYREGRVVGKELLVVNRERDY